MAGAVEGHAGGVHHVVEERPDGVVGIDLVDRHGNLLASRPGEGDVQTAFGIDGGVGDRMKVLGDRHGDPHHAFIAGDSIDQDGDLGGGNVVGNAGDDEVVGADDNRGAGVAELHLWTFKVVRS